MTQQIQSIRNVTKNYGVRTTESKWGARTPREGLIKTALWTFDYDGLPVGGASSLEQVIPANSTIISARVRVLTAFTSTSTTTDLTIGLEQSDGTDIDVDGFVKATDATQTTIAVARSIITGSGDLVGKTIGTADGELVVIPSVDDLLTGRAEVIVEYMTPAPAAAS